LDTIKHSKNLSVRYTLIQCFNTMGYCTTFSFASVYLLSRGFSNSQIGLTLTLASAFTIIFQPIVATFADKTKKLALKNIVAIILGIMAIVSFLLMVSPEVIIPIIILFIINSALFSSQIPLVTSMAMEHINSGVPVNYSLSRGIGSLAFAILCSSMGFLVDDFGAWVIMLANIGLGMIGVVLVSLFPRPQKPPVFDLKENEKASGLLEFALNNKNFMLVVVSVAMIFFSHVVINAFTIQIVNNIGGDNSDMGIAVAIAAFLELPAMALFPRIYRKVRNAGLILKVAAAFFVLKAVITLLAPSISWFIVAQCFQFFAYAMLTPASVYYVNEVISDADKNKGQMFMLMTGSICGLVANLVSGLILDSSGGVRLMMIVSIAVSFAGLVMLVLVDKSKGKRTRNSEM
jgi:PPP family 3-phenylpropionic acid transporter